MSLRRKRRWRRRRKKWNECLLISANMYQTTKVPRVALVLLYVLCNPLFVRVSSSEIIIPFTSLHTNRYHVFSMSSSALSI